jgi:pilus assembly protein CpaB
LSSLIEEGKRAVTVRVDDVRGVAGLILPGDHVDVVLIRMEQGQRLSNVILQAAKVLAVDQLISDRPGQAGVTARAVTLEVTPDQAQKVMLANEIGNLSLMLQQPGGEGTASRRISEKDLSFLDPSPAASTSVVAPEAPINSITVGIIRGTKREDYTVLHFR